MHKNEIETLFLDIGQVLLSNGWDRYAREKAVTTYGLDPAELSDRHHIFFETYELGKITLHEYLEHVIFHEPRSFSAADFTKFMFEQSMPIEDSISYFTALKQKYGLRVFSINNEGREIHEHRMKFYKLNELFDGFISSCYVHLRKPDKEIFRMACGVAHTEPENALFIDDRIIHVQIAQSLGIRAVQFQALSTTKKSLEPFGFIL